MRTERERWELSVYNSDLRQKRVIAARLNAGEITTTEAEAQRELLRAVRTAILERGRPVPDCTCVKSSNEGHALACARIWGS